MDLSVFLTQILNAPNLASMNASALALPAPVATDAEAKAEYQRLSEYMSAKDHRNAVASTLALLRLDGSKWLARMRRDGLFRASNYGYDGGCSKKVVGAALTLSTASSMSPKQIQYLESVQALLTLASPARQIHRGIVDRLKARKGPALKTLLAFVNSAFSTNWMGSEEADESAPLRWGATDLASAYSRIYMVFRDDLGIGARTWIWTDDSASSMHEGVYSTLLVDALRLNEFIDAEVMLDGLPYKAETTPNGVLISAVDPAFERSVRLGYIQADQQLLLRASSPLQHLGGAQVKLPSFQDAASAFFDAGLLDCELRSKPVERYVLSLPDFAPLKAMLDLDGVFLEEAGILMGALIDSFQEPKNTALQVSEHLWAMDVIKAQRLFNLIDMAFRRKLDTVEDSVRRRVLALRSTVMVVARPNLLKMLEVVMSQEKAQELISLLSLSTTSSTTGADVYIDLQYRPFVQSPNSKGDFITIAPAVVAKSNLLRSIMHASGVKKATVAANDPMQVAVAKALQAAGFLVRESFNFNIDGKRETDIFCYRDGVLFVLECKNAYHPCSPHELRNSYDLVTKAEDQLDIRAKWLANADNQKRLFKALGWEFELPARVSTCVVMANRVFSGYRLGDHPVRQAHELINVLSRGYVGRGPNVPPRRFWRADTFEVADLLDYLDGKSVIHAQHAAMVPATRGISLKDRRLEFAHFVMDLKDMDRIVEESFNEVLDANLSDGGTLTCTPEADEL